MGFKGLKGSLRLNGWRVRRLEGWRVRRLDGWMVGWLDGWKDYDFKPL